MFLNMPYTHIYIAIIGDMKNSKEMSDRQNTQLKLQKTLNEINDLYASSIASNFTITLGDEFQGLLDNGSQIMYIIQNIKMKMYPVNIRFGIGIGRITTTIHPQISIGADGPAYYKARASIVNVKALENKKKKAMSDVEIQIEGSNESQELSFNTTFKLMYSLENYWTVTQREVINYCIFHDDKQINVAKHFAVSQSNIQQIFAKTHYYVYKEAFDSINTLLSEVNENAKL